MPFFLIMCELFNGVLHPKEEMSVFWAYTMYYLAPFTYWIGGILSMIMKGAKVTCTASELITFHAPPNQTCVQYAGSWISSATGYLANPDDMGNCQYCSYKYGDEVGNTFTFSLLLSFFISFILIRFYFPFFCLSPFLPFFLPAKVVELIDIIIHPVPRRK